MMEQDEEILDVYVYRAIILKDQRNILWYANIAVIQQHVPLSRWSLQVIFLLLQ